MTGPDEPIDRTDLSVLADVADLYATVDPVPPGLVDRIRFAVAVDETEDLDLELMRLVEQTEPAGARGERSRILTFSGAALTLTIRIIGLTADAVRVDGWLAPPAPHRVTLRLAGGRADRTADEDGRFVFEETPAGLAQLVVRPAAPVRRAANVLATPAVVL